MSERQAPLGIMGPVHHGAESTIVFEGFKGAPEVPPLCRETQSLGQQMLNKPFSINGLSPLSTICICIRQIPKRKYADADLKDMIVDLEIFLYKTRKK